MKNKKLKLSILLSLIFVFVSICFSSTVKAVSSNEELYLGIQEYRQTSDPENMGYAINNPDDNGTSEETMVGANIWKIVQYNSSSEQDNVYNTDTSFYCVKAGVGFSKTSTRQTYKKSYDFIKDKEEINSTNNTVLQSIVTTDNYYGIIALADLMYIPESSSEQDKENLIKNMFAENGIAEENIDKAYPVKLTDEDIDAVQQAALWYYTNYDSVAYEKVYNQYNKDLWFMYKTDKEQEYHSLSDYNPSGTLAGEQREEQAKMLYNYLITKANENIPAYKTGEKVSKNKITLYTDGVVYTQPTKGTCQPVITIEKRKDFDMALRKYITKIGDTTLSDTNSRVPSIDESTIAESGTATYSHKKDPVTVKTGDIVTYNIAIYNEGDKEGAVTKIVDQLPTGLKFKSLKTTGYTASYDEETNRVTITKEASNSKTLPAYTDGTQLETTSEIIEIECEVTQKADSTKQVILTNVAWIAEEYDAEDGITITTEVGQDRDSEPGTTPDVNKDNMQDYKGTTTETDLSQNIYYPGQQDDDDFEKLIVESKEFDLRLKKTIYDVNGTQVPERILSVDVSNLNKADSTGNKVTDADIEMNKTPVTVKKGDIIRYRIRVYNEGEIDGYASEISEDIPDGLEFMWSEQLEDELRQDPTLTDEEIEAILYNQLIWTPSDINTDTQKIEMVKTNYLAKGEGLEKTEEGVNLIKAFDSSKGYVDNGTEKNPDYRDIYIYMKVVSDNLSGTIIRNEAAVTGDTDENGDPVDDRDSEPENWPGKEPEHNYQDDEDYDNVILEDFDLALRKFIIAVSEDTQIEDDEYLKDENGRYTREPIVDTSKLNTVGTDGKLITTAVYNHPKNPVIVDKDDVIVYMLRIYNEGQISGYATEVTDYLPEGLDFVEGEFNTQYGWTYDEETREVKTTYLQNTLINKAETNESGEITLDYTEVPIMCKLNDKVEVNVAETNIAEISKSQDEDGTERNDRDSNEDNVNVPSEEEKPSYKDDETGEYIPGQEDDDDFEKVMVKPFDLALRKFITQVEKEEVTNRIPQVKYDSENNKITYEHSKEPVDVVTGNRVIYTIRVYNEGARDGYASEISDDIPAGLEFLPEDETNTEYRWVMYDKDGNETQEVENAVKITTDYLSKEQGEARMEEDSTIEENPALLKAFNPEEEISETNPDYADVKVAFKVTEPNTSDKVIVNSAQISEDTDKDGDPVEDEDSTPDEWNEGEDDQDKEYIKLNYFDLSLRKWVTQAIVIENGKETVTQTGHTAEQDPEPIVKVDLDRKKLNQVTVKFRFSIRVTNEGDIAGYAKEIKDYIPEGLKFEAEDNPGWTDLGNNVVSTDLLSDKLLQPGESAEVEILLTWINKEDNMGLKTNTAEISKDYNEKGVPDIDSTPDNKKEGEDDIDDAPVMLSVKTGQAKVYYTLGLIVLVTIAGGIVLIKKFVL